MKALITTAVLLGALASPTFAQIDPSENIKRILESIDEELEEIDRLLLESSRKPDGAATSGVEHMRKMVKETQGSQERVVKGLDELIEELQRQQQGGGSGQPQDQQERQDQQQQQDQQQSQRRENERQRPEDQQQQQQQQQNANNDEDSARQVPRNVNTGAQRPDGQDRHVRDADQARWGNLPQYDLGPHSRGGLPNVPEKYRKLLEAYQKNNQKARRTR